MRVHLLHTYTSESNGKPSTLRAGCQPKMVGTRNRRKSVFQRDGAVRGLVGRHLQECVSVVQRGRDMERIPRGSAGPTLVRGVSKGTGPGHDGPLHWDMQALSVGRATTLS